MNVLVACEESQRVCTAFREKGHNAFSCDILPCSGGHPEWHIQGDVVPLINGFCSFKTQNMTDADEPIWLLQKWDLIVAHPPCTRLCNSGQRWLYWGDDKYKSQKIAEQQKAIVFFMMFALADCDKIAIENPIGVMSTAYRKPNQIIHPYMFGDPERKATCLWLKGLPELKPTNIVEPNIITYKNGKGTDSPWHMNTMGLPKEERAKARSKTFPGVALAMAEQWG